MNKTKKIMKFLPVFVVLAVVVSLVSVHQSSLAASGSGKVDDQMVTTSVINNQQEVNQGKVVNGTGNMEDLVINTNKQVQNLVNMVNQLMIKVQKLQDQIDKQEMMAVQGINVAGVKALGANVPEKKVDPAVQAVAGIMILGGVSGPGYPTGPLNLSIPATKLLLDRIGAVKEAPGALNIADRQYEAPLETIPPTLGAFPVTINGVANTATQLKVISNLKVKNGVGQHQGMIDVDIDTVPSGHVTLQYNGTANVFGSVATGLTIVSKGTFKTAKTTGIFAGLVAEGTYEMTIVEGGSVFGSPVTITINTVSP